MKVATNFDPSESELMSDINITPFVDVVLVLLVIFMVTAPMMVKEVMELKLPQSKSTNKSKAKTFSVAISKVGQVLFDGELIDLSLLIEKALRVKQKFPNLQLVISADREAIHGDIIAVLDRIKQAGITNFAFQVEKIIDE